MYSSVKCIYIVVKCIFKMFSSCKGEIPYTLNNDSPFLLFLASGNTVLLSVFMNLTTLGTSYKWNHTVYVFLILIDFT